MPTRILLCCFATLSCFPAFSQTVAFNVFNHTYNTSVITRAYIVVNGVIAPSPRLGEGSATGGFPDGTNARRAQAYA